MKGFKKMRKQNMDSGFALEARPKTSRRRKFAAITASVLAGAMLLTGTFAWSSISQRATNPIQGTPPPIEEGGRIHDHFNGSNKDVFAENFGESPLFVRIQLREFLEFNGVSQVGTGALRDDYMTWPVHNPTGTPANIGTNTNGIGNYMSWTMGGQSTFMPTFNHQITGNGGLQTEASGRAIDYITGGSTAAGGNNGSANFWNVGEELEDMLLFDGGFVTRTHVAGNTIAPRTGIPNNGVITMAQWQALPAANRVGNFWVIDTDGWAYWANFLMPGTATSLLLDAIHPNMPSVDWYYAIHVTGEFATVDGLADWRATTSPPGSAMGPVPSTNAEDLIARIIAMPAHAGNTPWGDTFVDGAGIEWIVAYRTTAGQVQLWARDVFGANPINAPFAGVQWNTVDEFGSWNVAGPVNNRLVTLWNEIGSDIRNIALPVVAATDFYNTPATPGADWQSRGVSQWTRWPIGDARSRPGATGFSAPGSGVATAQNGLFILTTSEILNRSSGQAHDRGVVTGFAGTSLWRRSTCVNGTYRHYWARTVGYTSPNATVAIMNATNGAFATRAATITNVGIRPSIWVAPQ